jgi:hypothetical protein
MNGDLSAIKDAQNHRISDKDAGYSLADFFPKDSGTTLGKINEAMSPDGRSAFQALPKVEPPPQNQLTKNDTSFNVQAAMVPIALDHSKDKYQEEAMKVFDNI